MKPTLLIALLLLLTALPIPCINHMDIMTTMTGEHLGSQMGYQLTSLDFNGDGYNDLVVESASWTSSIDSLEYGRLYFYMGGTAFDSIPEYVWTGQYPGQFYCFDMFNGGDINNDGKEDLVMVQVLNIEQDSKLVIYYGREIPIMTPDFELNFSHLEWSLPRAYYLGDINADGYDDIEIELKQPSIQGFNRVIVLKGGTLTTDIFMDNSIIYNRPLNLIGIGDVNNDGVDDAHMFTGLSNTDFTQNKLIVYWGSSLFPDLDSLVICNNTNQVVEDRACPLGDVNGDGIDDFISDMGGGLGGKVWLGRPDLSSQWDVYLTPYMFGSPASKGPAVVSGDFNNDGFNDIIGSNSDANGWSGRDCLWLGGPQMNGTVDLYLYPEYPHACQFGWAKTAGDFNGDGICDVAISKPYDFAAPNHTEGIVYIYTGNADLSDTTIISDDSLSPMPEITKWNIAIYPNPTIGNSVDLNVKFLDTEYKTLSQISCVIYNAKGQKIKSILITHKQIESGMFTYSLGKIPKGIYLVEIRDNNQSLITKKLSIE